MAYNALALLGGILAGTIIDVGTAGFIIVVILQKKKITTVLIGGGRPSRPGKRGAYKISDELSVDRVLIGRRTTASSDVVSGGLLSENGDEEESGEDKGLHLCEIGIKAVVKK